MILIDDRELEYYQEALTSDRNYVEESYTSGNRFLTKESHTWVSIITQEKKSIKKISDFTR